MSMIVILNLFMLNIKLEHEFSAQKVTSPFPPKKTIKGLTLFFYKTCVKTAIVKWRDYGRLKEKMKNKYCIVILLVVQTNALGGVEDRSSGLRKILAVFWV